MGDINPKYPASFIWVQGKIREVTGSTWKQVKIDLWQVKKVSSIEEDAKRSLIRLAFLTIPI
ncbi:MAG: hypothetical protein NVSMB38_38840 [Ktedonobacteraceae bacterium]